MWGTAVANPGKAPRYHTPDNWVARPFEEVVARTGRQMVDKDQGELWSSKKADAASVMLFMAGNSELLLQKCIAVIGARKVSKEGQSRARKLGRQLAEQGIVVVSGLADGVDTAALTGAIEAGGDVVAVIGTPLSKAYPAKNKALQTEIYESHLLISQFPEGSRVFPSNFPARNKTMAALTDASVVVEASDTSGTLHQAVECQRIGRWLGILQSVVEDPKLTWPQKFLKYEKCVVLRTTEEFLAQVY